MLRTTLLAVTGLTGTALYFSQAAAQEPTAAASAVQQDAAPEAQGRLNEIVVTATRRATNLQDTPVAVSAVDATLIRQASPRDIADISVFVPNFSAATISGFNAASFAMRGVGQNNIIVYFEPPVAVLVDDFVMPSVQTQILDTFDIDQVEVLRGPQGTLFGKNTTGGAVTVRTKRPEIGELGAEVRGLIGSFKTREAQAAINIPIGDTLAARFVGSYEYSDGYYKNGACYGPVTPFAPSKFAGAQGCGDGEKLGGKDVFAGRAKLLWEPNSAVTALLQYEIIRDSSESVPSVNETPQGQGFLFDLLGVGRSTSPTRDPLDNAGITDRSDPLIFMEKGHRVNVDGGYLNADFDLGLGTITSVTGYRSQRSRLPSSYPGQAPRAADGSVLSLFDASRDDNRKTFQQEVRFASDLDGPLDFVTGGFYQRDKVDFCVNWLLGFLDLTGASTPFGAFNDTPYLLCNGQRARSTALFAEATYELSDRLTLTAGGRYTWERKKWRGRQQAFIPLLGGGLDPTIRIDEPLDASVYKYPANTIELVDKASEPTWRVSLGYKAGDDIFLYATYSRGFKGGSFNDQIGAFSPFTDPVTGVTDFAAFREAASATDPELADSYEAGIKTELLDRRLRLNLTGFYVEYKDMQRQIVVPIEVNGQPGQVTRFFNAAGAKVKGIEAEAVAVPFEGLTLRGVLGYQDGRYTDYVTPVPAGYDLASAPLDRTPKWQWTLDGNYEFDVGNIGSLALNANLSHVSRNLFTQSITSPAENTYLDARTLLNASITLAASDASWAVRAIGRNLTNERYKLGTQVVGGLWSYAQYGAPRFFGLEVSYRFGSR